NCPRCQEKNSPIAKFCLRCGTPMEIQAAIQIEEQKELGDDFINALRQNPKFRDMMYKMAVELGFDKKLS
ncbi:TPA: zinc ribbon domain-containing protein, partial [Candidatus Woesearchaeota archaeon]|nr:zinc ribbon domain-containing protein [Candidatus Woesearchaeota archaeon]